jgi:ABC-type nitrate/sulfonate/bicarbonate transport system permease component
MSAREDVLGDTVRAMARPETARGAREGIIALGALALAWQALSYVGPPFAVPGWERILRALVALPMEFALVSVARVGVALVVSFAVGGVLAVLMYRTPSVERYGMPIVRVVLAVPAVCWIIFAVLWFKGVEFRIGFVLLVTCAPVFVIDLLDALKAVPREWRQMVQSFRPRAVQFFLKLMLPAIAPAILTSWKINVSLAIRIVTFADLVGAVSGIAYLLVVAEQLFSVADVFAGRSCSW